jgi:NTE family protein
MAQPITGLVLAGGGVRGAYEVGVLQGIVEALGLRAQDMTPFQIFSGTSVGAINAAYLTAHAQRGDLNVNELATIYRRLDITTHLKFGMRQHQADEKEGGWTSRAFIDPRPLELLVRRSMDWDALHHNLGCGLARALIIAAFNLLSGQTTIFAETMAGIDLRSSSMDRRRVTQHGPISADHVLASAAIPLLFPARKVGDAYYCDGGVRFNTPISPAIRAGAERLVIISLQSDARAVPKAPPDHSPSTQFIAGRLLNALLLDPFQYDLAVLQRLNRMMETLEEIVPPDEMKRIESLFVQLRGNPYRRLETLLFTPSEDLGRIANDHLKRHLASWKVGAFPRFLLRKAALDDATWEADWAAYLMFDGAYAGRLIDLGLEDARRRASDIRAFFGA